MQNSQIPIRALLLDLDKTLLDKRGFPQSIAATCRELASTRPQLDSDRLFEANSKAFEAFHRAKGGNWALGRISGEQLGLKVWHTALEACGCDDLALARTAVDTQIALAQEMYRPFPDVPNFVEAVRHAGVPVALVTNGASDTQRQKIAALELTDWFDAFAISGETGVAKPDSAAFAPALQKLGISGKAVWHVGDSLAADVAGANAAGLTSVWINRDQAEPHTDDPAPDLEIGSLLELEPCLKFNDS